MRARTFHAARRATAFVAVVLLLIVTYPIFCALGQRARFGVRRFWSRFTCWLLGVRIRASGRAATEHPTVLVANHVSYLDVIVLGTLTDATFIAKSEVDGWPLFGYIARRVGTMFIRRHWRQALVQRNEMAARMRTGESFVLFAEGTSSNGLGTRPFKTSLLSVAEPWVIDRPVLAQPVTIVYTRLADGRPYTAETCDLYAWYDDMDFAPHLWDMLKRSGVEVEVHFHEPVPSAAVTSRKVLGPAFRQAIHERLMERRARVASEVPAPSPARTVQARDDLPEPVAQ